MAKKKNKSFRIGPGRPRTWESPEELKADIDAYFKWADDNPIEITYPARTGNDGKPLTYDSARPYTVEGLCRYLGCDRKTLINYQKAEGYEEYHELLDEAKNRIAEQKLERGLAGTSPAAVTIFDLKNNHGYKDTTHVEMENLNRLKEFFPNYEEGEEA